MEAGTILIEYKYYRDDEAVGEFGLSPLYSRIYKRILVTNHTRTSPDDKTIILNHTNKGKDIGAKLLGIDFVLEAGLTPQIVLFVHDKKSPHSPLGSFWYKNLTKIFSDSNFKVLESELKKADTGICCSKTYIQSEYSSSTKEFTSTNNSILKKLLFEYKLSPPPPFYFVAGTIFGCKWVPVRDFFLQFPPLQIREQLEEGNVHDTTEGTLTHSWERMLSWIITSRKLKIKGL